MPDNMEDTRGPVLATLVAVEFGNRVAVIGDERKVDAIVAAGKTVTVATASGDVKVTPGARWIKRNGAQRFNLRGDKGHGPRGGRKRYPQPIAAFYVEGVEPMSFEDGATLLAADADSHDTAAGKVTGRGKGRGKAQSDAVAAPTNDIAALLAAIPRDTLLAALGAVPVDQVQPAPAPAPATNKVRSSRTPRKSAVSTAQTAETLLGV